MRYAAMGGDGGKVDRKSPYRLQVLDRAVAVLDAISRNGQGGLTLSEAAKSIGVAKSTVHRLLIVLEQSRFVLRRPMNDKYVLGVKLFQLGCLAVPEKDLRDRAHPYLEHLAKETGETTHLGVLDEGQVLHVDHVESEHTLRLAVVLGSYHPASTTALGKMLLAYLPEEQFETIIHRHGLPARTRNSLTTIMELKKELRLIKDHGYALDNEEDSEGLRCVAAPVRGVSGAVLASLSVAGPSIRMTDRRIPVLVGLVVESANRLSEELGAGPCRILLPNEREIINRLHR
jgi:DNA-binding IclR family transcriptional regulator